MESIFPPVFSDFCVLLLYYCLTHARLLHLNKRLSWSVSSPLYVAGWQRFDKSAQDQQPTYVLFEFMLIST